MSRVEDLTFKETNSFEKRLKLSVTIRTQYPDRIPVVVERHPTCKNVPPIEKEKFLAPSDISVAQFVAEIRNHIALDAETSIFLFVNKTVIPQGASSMLSVYDRYQDKDGFLYIWYSGQNTFGG